MSFVVDGDNGRKVDSSGPALSVAGEQKDLVQIALRYEGKECSASINSVGLGINSQQTATYKIACVKLNLERNLWMDGAL